MVLSNSVSGDAQAVTKQHAALGDLIVSGSTRTNVNDCRALLLGLD